MIRKGRITRITLFNFVFKTPPTFLDDVRLEAVTHTKTKPDSANFSETLSGMKKGKTIIKIAETSLRKEMREREEEKEI